MLLELDYAQAYAVYKESVDAEGALFAPAAAYVKALWFPVLNLVPFSDTEIMASNGGEQLVEVCPSVLADLQNDFVHGLRQEICRDQNSPTAASDFRRQISKSNLEIPQPRCKFWCGKLDFLFIGLARLSIPGYAKPSISNAHDIIICSIYHILGQYPLKYRLMFLIGQDRLKIRNLKRFKSRLLPNHVTSNKDYHRGNC